MTTIDLCIQKLGNEELLTATRGLVRRSVAMTADLLLHLGEIDARRLYLGRAFSSMFGFCVGELGFSEDVVYNHIQVARVARKVPAVIDALRGGRVHLTGLRILAPHLTQENCASLLAEAAGKTKRDIEELAARLAPKPPVADSIRKLPQRAAPAPDPHTEARAAPAEAAVLDVPVLVREAAPRVSSVHVAAEPEVLGVAVQVQQAAPLVPREPVAARMTTPVQKAVMSPLSENTFKIQFTASRALRDKLREAQDLLRHSVPDGELAPIVERAIDILIEDVKKKRFGLGRKPKPSMGAAGTESETPATRHVPMAIRREVVERDGGRCTFTDATGRRCTETGALELDHVDGFARTAVHSVSGIRLRCRAHNQYAAEQMYGRAFMERARKRNESSHSKAPLQETVELAPGRPLQETVELAPGRPLQEIVELAPGRPRGVRLSER